MGVTNRNKVHYKNSEHGSSTESLHIPNINSDGSSIQASVESIPIIISSRSRHQKRHKTELFVSIPRHVGRRRQRRLKAVAELSALLEEEEPEDYLEEGIPHNSLFTTITDNPNLEHILEKLTDDETYQENLQDQNTETKLPGIKLVTASYKNISFHVKVTFKVLRSVYQLEKTESEILDFFANSPEKTYFSSDKSSFQRLLIHGISQYYCFKSKSYNGQDGRRKITVENPNNYYIFRGPRLWSIVQDNHNKRI